MINSPCNCSSIFRAYLRLQGSILKILLLSLALLTILPGQASDVLIIDPNKRLEASICADSMNRIAVANDRITQIFGDEGTFESQNDENTGQVFLKPTAENGSKNLSLTLITEQGITQDLTLKPTAKSATTLILQNNGVTKGVGQKANSRSPQRSEAGVASEPNPLGSQAFPSQFQERSFCPQDHLLALIKQAALKQLPLQESGFFGGTDIARANPEGLKLIHQQSYAASPYGVHVFDVENTSPASIEIEEKSFYQAGDLAISVEKRTLTPNSSASLYVITWEDTRVEGQRHD